MYGKTGLLLSLKQFVVKTFKKVNSCSHYHSLCFSLREVQQGGQKDTKHWHLRYVRLRSCRGCYIAVSQHSGPPRSVQNTQGCLNLRHLGSSGRG